jgi:hypothetical protein
MLHRHGLRRYPRQKKSHPLPDGLFLRANTGPWSSMTHKKPTHESFQKSYNAHVLARKYVGVTFAPFAKGMTTYFCRSGTVCYDICFFET